MILEFDIGNSNIKWRHLNEASGCTLASGRAESVEELVAGPMSACEPTAARLCSVRNDDAAQRLQEWIERRWGVVSVVAKVTRHCGGVSNRYKHPENLGIDRWLAMLAAYGRTQTACVVVDAGTAFTLDAIAADGNHLGGYILPGIGLSATALEGHTGIRLSPRQSGDISLGLSTESAVHNGILGAIHSLISRTLSSLSAVGEELGFFMSGGDAELIRNSGNFVTAVIVPELVMDGLAIACDGQPAAADHNRPG